MAGPANYLNTNVGINQCWGDTGARGNFALDSAYTHNTSGDGLAFRYQPMTSSPVAKVLFFIDDYAGTVGNVSVRVRCYNENTSSRPGTTLRATASTVTLPASADKWAQAEFGTTYAHGVGEVLFFVLDNTAVAPTVDYPSILTATAIYQGHGAQRSRHIDGYTSTAGFSANGTAVTHVVCVFVHADGTTAYGQPFTRYTATYWSSGTYERGIVITPPTRIVVGGVGNNISTGAMTAASGFKIYQSNVAAGGTPLLSQNLGTDANETTDETILYKAFDSSLTLHPSTTYYAVYTFGSATQSPSVLEIEDYSTYSTIFALLPDDFGLCRSVYDNGGTWTASAAASTRMGLAILSFSDMTAGVAAVSGITLQQRGDVFVTRRDVGAITFLDIDYRTYDDGATTVAMLEIPGGLNLLLEEVYSYHSDSAVAGTIDVRIMHAPFNIDALNSECLTIALNASRRIDLRSEVNDAYYLPLRTVGPCWLYIATSGGDTTAGKLRIIGTPL